MLFLELTTKLSTNVRLLCDPTAKTASLETSKFKIGSENTAVQTIVVTFVGPASETNLIVISGSYASGDSNHHKETKNHICMMIKINDYKNTLNTSSTHAQEQKMEAIQLFLWKYS